MHTIVETHHNNIYYLTQASFCMLVVSLSFYVFAKAFQNIIKAANMWVDKKDE